MDDFENTCRYFLFAGSDYYPAGGMRDYVGTFFSEQEARDARPDDCGWAHVAEYDAEGILPFAVVAVWEPANREHISRWRRVGCGARLLSPESLYVE